jgi:hypothetical protein
MKDWFKVDISPSIRETGYTANKKNERAGISEVGPEGAATFRGLNRKRKKARRRIHDSIAI